MLVLHRVSMFHFSIYLLASEMVSAMCPGLVSAMCPGLEKGQLIQKMERKLSIQKTLLTPLCAEQLAG